MQLSNGVKLWCTYCSVLFFAVADCFCGSKFQFLAQDVLKKRRFGWFGLTVLQESFLAVVEPIIGNGCLTDAFFIRW